MALPLPPLEMRELVGAPEIARYENPTGAAVYRGLETNCAGDVFDFGCGCGRLARQFLEQRPQPRSYVGVDLHAGMIRWCNEQLAPLGPQFRFEHLDVYNAGLNPSATAEVAPFPAPDAAFDLVIANSVFTHIIERIAPYYLAECARILRPGGILAGTWFLFDKGPFPMMQSFQNALYINTEDPTNAVIYDRAWFVKACAAAGFEAARIEPPELRGFHWQVELRRSDSPGEILLPADLAPIGTRPPPVPTYDPAAVGRVD